jgi:hypothetical protein
MYEHGYGKEINKDGRHVGLDFYDLLIETIMSVNADGLGAFRCPSFLVACRAPRPFHVGKEH